MKKISAVEDGMYIGRAVSPLYLPFLKESEGYERENTVTIDIRKAKTGKWNPLEAFARAHAEKMVKESAFYQSNSPIFWEEAVVNFITGSMLYLNILPRDEEHELTFADLQNFLQELEKNPYILSHVMAILNQNHPAYELLKCSEEDISEYATISLACSVVREYYERTEERRECV
ncbi:MULTISPECIES: hypothetical protein [Bacillus]|uniref:hypothetical protein n=1 Tax=Bacillus TaxID=1386 RepID=UPI000F89F1E5|nr:hypothetical protein [Bacillus thuringiensis]AZR80577.1 hypothetical protein BtSCAC15_30935 [Bacillus thuringiensis]MBG9521540.1 hypothetical protein [Bacillus thuringiensis]HDR3896862.1 hypothetical protein [Bacillus cereus]